MLFVGGQKSFPKSWSQGMNQMNKNEKKRKKKKKIYMNYDENLGVLKE
jgi:hypothetical protein